MAEPSRTTQEPSMEEILSSIRRIIADEESAEPAAAPARAEPRPPMPMAAAPPPPAASAPMPEEDDEVLELTEVVDQPRAMPLQDAAPAPASPAPASPAAALPTAAPEPEARSKAMPAETVDTLISPTAASASTQAFARLTRSLPPEERQAGQLGELTVERLLIELLTPMLKDWLDQHLPDIVERVVEQEVKKLARRAELL